MHEPSFHEEQILRWADPLVLSALVGRVVGCWNWAKAQLAAMWSHSRHRLQKVPAPWGGWLRTVVACKHGWMVFHASPGSMAACCRNSRSYSIHPRPPCLIASLIRRIAYASLSLVVGSDVPTAR